MGEKESEKLAKMELDIRCQDCGQVITFSQWFTEYCPTDAPYIKRLVPLEHELSNENIRRLYTEKLILANRGE